MKSEVLEDRGEGEIRLGGFRGTAWERAEVTFDDRTANQLALSWGTRPVIINEQPTPAETAHEAVETAARVGAVRRGDTVVVVSGSRAVLARLGPLSSTKIS